MEILQVYKKYFLLLHDDRLLMFIYKDMFDAIKIDPVPLYFRQVMDDGYRIFHKISTMKTPVISLLDGFVSKFLSCNTHTSGIPFKSAPKKL